MRQMDLAGATKQSTCAVEERATSAECLELLARPCGIPGLIEEAVAAGGNLVSSDGTSQAVSQSQTFAVTQLNPIGCQVLDLVLAPLDLNLLGLVVHLDRVHLNITAVPGAGNLLGNLLCALVGLLDGPGPLAQIAALLNQILAALGL